MILVALLSFACFWVGVFATVGAGVLYTRKQLRAMRRM